MSKLCLIQKNMKVKKWFAFSQKTRSSFGWKLQKTPQKKKFSASNKARKKQSIASKLANMFAKVWCYSLGLLASCLRRWIFFRYVTFRFSHHLAIFLVIFQAIKHSIYNFFINFHVLVCYELKKIDTKPND